MPFDRTMTVDDFIDYGTNAGQNDLNERYARWVLHHMRSPASCQFAFEPFMQPHELYCTYAGKRYRVVMASRMGDIGISRDFSKAHGYDARACVAECSEWSDKPEYQQTLVTGPD